MPRATLVLNPISGRGSRARAAAVLADRLGAAGWEVAIRPTAAAGEGERIAREAAEQGVDVVVAAGGDGTANEIARGILAAPGDGTALALLPSGTSNLLARDLGLGSDPEQVARVILDGGEVRLDVAFVGDRPSLACVGFGWDARIVEEVSRTRKGHIGFHTYLLPIFRAMASYSFPRMRITSASGESAEGEFVIVLNARPYAAFFTPAPQARPDDGLLDAVVLERRGPLDFPRWAWRACRGTLHHDEAATVLRSTSFRIEAEEPVPFQVDGDVGGSTPVDILVRPGALRVRCSGPPER